VEVVAAVTQTTDKMQQLPQQAYQDWADLGQLLVDQEGKMAEQVNQILHMSSEPMVRQGILVIQKMKTM
jgi:hypothetical protein